MLRTNEQWTAPNFTFSSITCFRMESAIVSASWSVRSCTKLASDNIMSAIQIKHIIWDSEKGLMTSYISTDRKLTYLLQPCKWHVLKGDIHFALLVQLLRHLMLKEHKTKGERRGMGKEKAHMSESSNTLLYCSCKELSAPSDPEPIAFALHCQNVPDGSV